MSHPENPSPYIEEVNIREVLQPWYLPISLYADQVRRIDDQNAVASFTITEPLQCGLHPILLVRGRSDSISEDGADFVTLTNSFTVTEDNTRGHFRKEVGLELFPGYQGVGSLIQTASFLRDEPVWLRELPMGAAFAKPIVPGMDVVAQGTLTDVSSDGFTMKGKVLRPDNERHTVANEMRFEPMDMPRYFSEIFPQHQLIEVAAQMAGGAALLQTKEVQEGYVPVFMRLNQSTFEKQHVRMGDTLRGLVNIKPNTRPDDPRINARVQITRHNGDAIADIGVVLAFVSWELIMKNVQEAQTQKAA